MVLVSRKDIMSKRASRHLGFILLASLLSAPVSLFAAPAQDHDQDHEQRVYDADHKDYHEWNDHENEAWQKFLAEKHRKDHEFAKASKKEQSEYWNWRHEHLQ